MFGDHDQDYAGPINPYREEMAELSQLRTDDNPARCHCRGSGWWLSPFDTWERCAVHPAGPHPEDYHGEDDQPEPRPLPSEEVSYQEYPDDHRPADQGDEIPF